MHTTHKENGAAAAAGARWPTVGAGKTDPPKSNNAGGEEVS